MSPPARVHFTRAGAMLCGQKGFGVHRKPVLTENLNNVTCKKCIGFARDRGMVENALTPKPLECAVCKTTTAKRYRGMRQGRTLCDTHYTLEYKARKGREPKSRDKVFDWDGWE